MSQLDNILLNGISLDFRANEQDILKASANKLKQAGYNPAGLHFQIYRRSIDARRRSDIRAVYSVLVSGEKGSLPGGNTLNKIGGRPFEELPLDIQRGKENMCGRPLIVGAGPAGMFCALLLAQNGYRPILIERGDCVDKRTVAVDRFVREHILDEESNIQFGAGGAGTFSDGKLVTRISDPRTSYVLRVLHEHGAPECILTQAKPHVGTDILKQVTANLLDEIQRLGGEVRFRTRLDGFSEFSNGINACTNNGKISCGVMVVALGHSARDTNKMLMSEGLEFVPKAFSVGARIEHLQSDIDEALYGKWAGDPALGPAEYALSDTTGERGVYTFCMCPGGEVAAASSEQGGLVVNGMSNYARNGRNANSAVLVSVLPEDFGNTVNGAVDFQRRIERAAFAAGGGNFCAPMQTVGDFLNGVSVHNPSRVMPSYMNGYVEKTDLGKIMPDFVKRNLQRGIVSFGKKISGFDATDAILTGVETRTSSPVRIIRNDKLIATGYNRIYPCGEGAGYAGGITSAAVDGIRVAQSIMAQYAPID